jgi:hypothetical protein
MERLGESGFAGNVASVAPSPREKTISFGFAWESDVIRNLYVISFIAFHVVTPFISRST